MDNIRKMLKDVRVEMLTTKFITIFMRSYDIFHLVARALNYIDDMNINTGAYSKNHLTADTLLFSSYTDTPLPVLYVRFDHISMIVVKCLGYYYTMSLCPHCSTVEHENRKHLLTDGLIFTSITNIDCSCGGWWFNFKEISADIYNELMKDFAHGYYHEYDEILIEKIYKYT